MHNLKLLCKSFKHHLSYNNLFYHESCNFFYKLGPGRPSAGGPRMDRQVVTSSEVVNVSRLASRLWRSARLLPAFGAQLGYTHTERKSLFWHRIHSDSSKKVRSKTVTNSLPKRCSPKVSPTACKIGVVQTITNSLQDRCGPKPSPTACQEGAVQNCHQQLAR